MSNQEELERAQAKTSEQQLKYALEQGFHYAPRIAEAIVAEAQDCLSGEQEGIQVGQMCVLLAKHGAANGRAMRETELVRVAWTVDAGGEDAQVAQKHGMRAMHQQRILRLLDEAVEQGAAASREDLAHALHSSVRTIKRDCAELQGEGYYLPTRGRLEGVGRGQTHKAQIIRHWLEGKSYDQIALHTRHSAKSIQRYIKAFEQVVLLERQGLSPTQMAQLLQIGPSLVQEYLAVYAQNDQPEKRQRLAEQFYPQPERLGNGWMVFTGTRAEGSKARVGQGGGEHTLVTMAWPVLLPEDLKQLSQQPMGRSARRQWLQRRMLRLLEFGYEQPGGPVLLTEADLSSMLGLPLSQTGELLRTLRREMGKELPTKGYYFDQGMRPSHKSEVVALYEQGMDEAEIARRVSHTPQSVGRYLRDYERVKMSLKAGIATGQIALMTGMQPNVVRAYVELLEQYHPELLPVTASSTPAPKS